MSITLPNTATVTKAYDSANRLTSVTNRNSAGTTLSSFSYGYQNDNLRSSCTESNGDVVSYGYDAAHRLTSESRTGLNAYSYSYTVDGVGNRTSQTKGGVTTSFTLNSDDELTATSGGFTNSYSYNAAGDQTNRTLSGTSNTLAYDYEGQLTSITVGGATTSFAYDALGRRITRTAGGTTKQFLSSGSQVWLESVGSTVTATYTYGNGLIRKDGEYFQVDGLGSARTITNSSQTVTGTATYEGFGATIATTGTSASPYLFAATSGYRTDGDAGLMHVGARYYDPQVGRFITRDDDPAEHPFLYCDHDPVNYTDPDGHEPQRGKGKPKPSPKPKPGPQPRPAPGPPAWWPKDIGVSLGIPPIVVNITWDGPKLWEALPQPIKKNIKGPGDIEPQIKKWLRTK